MLKMLAGEAARGGQSRWPPRCQHRAVGRGGRERFGHPPVLLPIPRPAPRSYFGQGKQDGSHTPPPPLLPPSFLQEKPLGPAMPPGRGPPRPGLGHHVASASPASSSSSPRSPPGPFPPRLLLWGGSGGAAAPALEGGAFPTLPPSAWLPLLLTPPQPRPRPLGGRHPRPCASPAGSAGPRGAPLEPLLPNHSGSDASSLLSPRSTQPPCLSPMAVEPPRSPSQPPSWQRRLRDPHGRPPAPQQGLARPGTPRLGAGGSSRLRFTRSWA